MEEKRAKYVPASVSVKTFSYPHCGAYAPQTCYEPYGFPIQEDGGLPKVSTEPNPFTEMQLKSASDSGDNAKYAMAKYQAKMEKRRVSGEVFLGQFVQMSRYEGKQTQLIENLHLSSCFACSEMSVWRQGKLLFPESTTAPEPNDDMPDDVKSDYIEADSILAKSPRGSAALLRLAIEKLCVHLGHKNKKINTAIKDMVADGLPAQIQKALDTVRVVGNEAVHPGTIDFKDNQQVALQLFGLVNFIVRDRITNPKAIDEIYENVVPESQRAQIAKRDAKKPTGKTD